MNVDAQADFLTFYFQGGRGDTLLPQIIEQEQTQFTQEVRDTVAALTTQQENFERKVAPILHQVRELDLLPEQAARLDVLENQAVTVECVQQRLHQGLIEKNQDLHLQQRQLENSQPRLQEASQRVSKLSSTSSEVIWGVGNLTTNYIRGQRGAT